jgi:hypothetical protein
MVLLTAILKYDIHDLKMVCTVAMSRTHNNTMLYIHINDSQ